LHKSVEPKKLAGAIGFRKAAQWRGERVGAASVLIRRETARPLAAIARRLHNEKRSSAHGGLDTPCITIDKPASELFENTVCIARGGTASPRGRAIHKVAFRNQVSGAKCDLRHT